MVDFKKLTREMRERRLRQEDPLIAEKLARVIDRTPPPRLEPVLETAFHRELSDPAYLNSLLRYADEHTT